MESIKKKIKFPQLTFRQKIFLILTFGLVIRLLLIPFFAHQDLFSTYGRAYKVAFEGNNLFEFSQPLSHLIETINLKIFSIFYNKDNFLPMSPLRAENLMVNWNLIIFKIPYLIADLLGFLLVMKISKKENTLSALILYFFNPISIFAVYMFGRYEVFPVTLILHSLYLLKEKKTLLSALVFGLCILSRTSFVILLPFLILLYGKNLWEKILSAILAVAPYGLVLAYKSFFINATNEAQWLTSGAHSNYVFGAKITLLPQWGTLYITIILLCIVMYFAAIMWIKHREKITFDTVSAFYGIALGLYFATTFYHPQYLAWIMPFVIVAVSQSKKYRTEHFLATSGISLALPLVLLTWQNAIIPQIALPLNYEAGMFDLVNLVNQYYDFLKLSDIGKSIVSALMFVISTYLIKAEITKLSLRKDSGERN